MSFRTCSWLLPQKEQRYGTLVPLDPVVVTRSVSRASLLVCRRPGLTAALARSRPLAARQAMVLCLCDERVAGQRVHRIDDAIRLGVVGTHEIVPVGVVDHLV